MNNQQPTANSQQATVNSRLPIKVTLYCLLLTTYCLLLALFRPHPALAHGGGFTQVSAAPVGPYRVTVWTAPQPIRAETLLHVTVAVADESQQPVLDATVLVQLYAAGADDALISLEATTAQSTNKLFYEVDFLPPQTGLHQIEVAVSGPEGQGTVTFDVEVEPPSNNTWLLIALAALILVAAATRFKSSPPVQRRRKQEAVSN